MNQHRNEILARLSASDYGRIEPHLSFALLAIGDRIAEPQGAVDFVYFPFSGILSFVVETAGGGAVETAVMGRDGAFGASQALDHQISLNSVIVQVPGEASVIAAAALRELALELPALRKLLIGFDLFMFAQAQQTAACNALHDVRQRTCRWLIRMHELVGDELPLTQEFLAQMMGVRRASVNDVAQELQAAGLIDYRRGQIRIRDAEQLASWSCECHDDLVSHYKMIIGNTGA